MTISNTDNVIDSRDVIARIEELTGELESLEAEVSEANDLLDDMGDDATDAAQEALDDAESAVREWEKENGGELAVLEALQDDCDSSDWKYGATLIRENYFDTYARELAEDLHGDAIRDVSWPFSCIDWERAASELQQDYSSTEFDGATYLYR